jgi:hypothetical protein
MFKLKSPLLTTSVYIHSKLPGYWKMYHRLDYQITPPHHHTFSSSIDLRSVYIYYTEHDGLGITPHKPSIRGDFIRHSIYS